MKLNVLFRDECDQVVEIGVLSVDSITQVKDKILNYFSHGQLSQSRQSPEEFDLVTINRDDEKTVLTDNGILQLSNGWRKINTLSDYKINDGACVELVKKFNTSQKHTALKEARHYSSADGSGYGQHCETNEGYTVPDEGYLIPDVDQGSGYGQHRETNERYIVPDEGYLIPDVDQVSTHSKDGDENLESNTKYYYPDEHPEYEEPDTPSDSNIKYYYPDENSEYEEPDTPSDSNIKYYYPDENSGHGKTSSEDDHSIYDEPEAGFGLWVWHLMKDDKVIHGAKTENQGNETNLQDIVRPYLPATGSVLQKYVKNVFDAFMNPNGSHVSCIVKDLFDFFDRKAAEKRTPKLANIWKSNVLLRGVYSTILTKPTIICDVKEYSYVQACLAVVDRTMGEICRNEVPSQDDSQGQLFSQLVPVYKTKLENYCKHITKMKKVEPATLEAEYATVEKAFAGTCDLLPAQLHLYKMLQNHIDKVCEKLQDHTDLVQKVRHLQTTFETIME